MKIPVALEPGHRHSETRQQGQERRQKADRKKTLSVIRQIHLEDAKRLLQARKAVESALGSYEDRPL